MSDSTPKITLRGIEDFKGDIIHTALWKDEIDLKGQKVAAIGCGCKFGLEALQLC